MRKITLLFIVILIGTRGNSQIKKISVNNTNKNTFYNEFWSKKGGYIFYEEYFFAENGTFKRYSGYSGGIHFGLRCRGLYKYNPSGKEIELQENNCYTVGRQLGKKYIAPPIKIFIKNLTDTTVSISTSEDPQEHIMERAIGRTLDQYWYNKDMKITIYTHLFGQVEIKHSTLLYEKEYNCNYHIVGNYLLLEVKSIVTRKREANERQTEIFSSPIKTYLKIDIKDDSVDVENIDLDKMMKEKRYWTFKNMEYQIEDSSTKTDKIIY